MATPPPPFARASDASSPRRRPTLRDVAAEVGVTTTTVSNAFSRPDQLSPALRERVLLAAAQLGYGGPDPAARSLRRGRAGALGVLYTDRLSAAFDDPAFVLFLQGLSHSAEHARLGLLLIPGAPRGQEEASRSAVAEAVVDALVGYSLPDDDPLLAAARARGLPLVVVDAPYQEGDVFVGVDDEAAAHTAAQHLLDLGHLRLAVVSLEMTSDRLCGPADTARQAAATNRLARARLAGYAGAVHAAGLSWSDVAVYEAAENVVEQGTAAGRWLLSRQPRPTGVLAMSDRLAAGVLAAAHESGLDVPVDVSVVGHDDVPLAALTHPPLTTIHQPHRDKGHQAGEILQARLHAARSESPLLPTRLMTRDSTAAPRRP